VKRLDIAIVGGGLSGRLPEDLFCSGTTTMPERRIVFRNCCECVTRRQSSKGLHAVHLGEPQLVLDLGFRQALYLPGEAQIDNRELRPEASLRQTTPARTTISGKTVDGSGTEEYWIAEKFPTRICCDPKTIPMSDP
jgi:hypothetical protein